MAAERRLLGPNVAVLFGASQGKYPDGNTVIVCGRDGTLVIDPALQALWELDRAPQAGAVLDALRV